jgi:hypothetical protein
MSMCGMLKRPAAASGAPHFANGHILHINSGRLLLEPEELTN